ncbi:cellulose biosynthesis protein BcsE, partial [Vibrio campbellii]
MSSIHGLSAITSEREIKSVYVNLFSHKRMAIDYLINTTCNTGNSSLTSFSDKASFLS